MRPLRLDMDGFTVFREPTTVDFTDADFFALVGPTGSGKSTVLDAICFALYGTVPRWGDRRGGIENALAPSAAEARVRLVFESAGARYVGHPGGPPRRQGQGHHRRTPGWSSCRPGFDLSPVRHRGRAADEPGQVLAGTPAEMDAGGARRGRPAVRAVHQLRGAAAGRVRRVPARQAGRAAGDPGQPARPARLRAGRRAGRRRASATPRPRSPRPAACSPASPAPTTPRSQAQADRSPRAQALVDEVERTCPRWRGPRAAGERAAAELAARGARDRRACRGAAAGRAWPACAEARPPPATRADAADAAVRPPRSARRRPGPSWPAAGDRTALTRLLDAHAERAPAAAGSPSWPPALAAADREHAKAAGRGRPPPAPRPRRRPQALGGAAAGDVEAAQTADRAASLRVHLVAGQPCPVCEQDGDAPCPPSSAPAVAAAAGASTPRPSRPPRRPPTRQSPDATGRCASVDRAPGRRPRPARAVAARLAALDAALDDAPTSSTVEAALRGHRRGRTAPRRPATEAVRAARQAARERGRPGPGHGRGAAARRVADVRRGPRRAGRARPAGRRPATTWSASWQALHDWAADRPMLSGGRDQRVPGRRPQTRRWPRSPTRSASGSSARSRRRARRSRRRPRPTGRRPRSAVERAEAAPRPGAGAARAGRAARPSSVAAHEREAQVAKALAQHLRADRFERWLLAEALDALVAGASRILRELSGGQYDLGHDKGEFFVVDHSDAGLRRGRAHAVRRRDLPGVAGPGAGPVRAARRAVHVVGQPGVDHARRGLRHARRRHPGHGRGDAGEPGRPRRPDGRRGHPRAALAERIPVRFEVSRDPRSDRPALGPRRPSTERDGAGSARWLRRTSGTRPTASRSRPPTAGPTGESTRPGPAPTSSCRAERVAPARRPPPEPRLPRHGAAGRRGPAHRRAASGPRRPTAASTPGVAASYAAGVVRCDLRRGSADVAGARVERGLFTPASSASDLVAGTVRYQVHRIASHRPPPAARGDPGPGCARWRPRSRPWPGRRRDPGARTRRRPAGGRRSAAPSATSCRAPWATSRPPGAVPAAGAVRSGRPAAGRASARPVFLLGTTWHRYTWYLRLPGPAGSPWAGVVRVECSADLARRRRRAGRPRPR